MTFWAIQILNTVSFGMLLFLLSIGLSLVFGLMRVLNLAHGSFYLLAGYIAWTVVAKTQSFALALFVAIVSVTLLGVVLERWILRRIYGDELRQALLTFGVVIVIGDQALAVWGGNPLTVPNPDWFTAPVQLGSILFPSYRLLVIGVGVVTAIALGWLQDKTRFGAMIRAGVDDPEITRVIGVNLKLVFTLVFAFGTALAALAGVIGGVIGGIYPGADLEVLLLALVVVVLGGLRSVKGVLGAALLVALLDNFGKVFFPELAYFSVVAPMAIVLAIRPQGLFARA
jgi:branched-chain amino acid transport system permease protein